MLTIGMYSEAQTITVAENKIPPVTNNREQAFAGFVESEETKLNKDIAPDTSTQKTPAERKHLSVIQKNISITTALPSGYDTTKTWQVKLDIGLTPKGTECFSDNFTLSKNTPKSEGAAFYNKNGQLNYEVTVSAIRNYPVYITVTFTGPSGQVSTQETIMNIKE